MKTSVFLSASIPLPGRHEKFLRTADVVAIRSAVKALVGEIIHQKGKLIFGGHPAITPLVAYMFEHMGLAPQQHVTLYQSAFFADQFPADNQYFVDVRVTDAISPPANSNESALSASLREMRERMLGENEFSCGVFIGGMEGIFDEYDLFSDLKPGVPRYPIASTGAAAALLYEERGVDRPELVNELTYSTLFRRLLRSGEKQ